MKIDCIGCLHGHLPKLEGGDLLIVTGDLTAADTLEEHLIFCDWILKQDYKKIVWIAGNHDMRYQIYGGCYFFLSTDKRDMSHIEYLCDSGITFENLKIWGMPWSLTFPQLNPRCSAFTCTEDEMKKHVAKIPDDIDIIISHSPMYGIHDKSIYGNYCGSIELRNRVEEIMPKLFVCSHIHEEGGNYLLLKGEGVNTECINCSIMDENYNPTNKPMRIEL